MTFDYELILFDITHSENEMGDSIEVETPVHVLCDVQSVTRSEHYAAGASGLKPVIVFVINKYDYSGQKKVEFEEKKYSVLREYSTNKSKSIGDFETLELICEGVVNHGTT